MNTSGGSSLWWEDAFEQFAHNTVLGFVFAIKRNRKSVRENTRSKADLFQIHA